MVDKQTFPILEFDCNMNAKIEPSGIVRKIDVPACCVISFFQDAIDDSLRSGQLKQVATFHTETISLPIYVTTYDGKFIGLVQGFQGAANAAGQLEELIAMGFSKFIVCGGAGVLQKGIQVGHLILPYSAVRDEGVSYHYIEPSREIECDSYALNIMERQLQAENIPYMKAKTWTTDAFYRETEDKIALRVAEGCVTVEMEAAAYFAVSKFRGVTLGQILYGGDDLSSTEWDSRQWNHAEQIRKDLLALSQKICLQL